MEDVGPERRLSELKLEMVERLADIQLEMTNGFQRVETEIRANADETRAMKEQVIRQNGRVTKSEDWQHKHDTETAFMRGVADGRGAITRAQFAFLAVVGPVVFALADLALKVFL